MCARHELFNSQYGFYRQWLLHNPPETFMGAHYSVPALKVNKCD